MPLRADPAPGCRDACGEKQDRAAERALSDERARACMQNQGSEYNDSPTQNALELLLDLSVA
jgi:hypothetical protein